MDESGLPPFNPGEWEISYNRTPSPHTDLSLRVTQLEQQLKDAEQRVTECQMVDAQLLVDDRVRRRTSNVTLNVTLNYMLTMAEYFKYMYDRLQDPTLQPWSENVKMMISELDKFNPHIK